jgi:hypothetical protein
VRVRVSCARDGISGGESITWRQRLRGVDLNSLQGALARKRGDWSEDLAMVIKERGESGCLRMKMMAPSLTRGPWVAVTHSVGCGVS